MSSIYNYRLTLLLPKLIPIAQKGFIRGRSITDNMIITHDVMHWCKKYGPNAILLSFDFTKAYDRVQWPFLAKVLQKMKFGERLQAFMKNWHHNQESALSINGFNTKPIRISRTVQQVDPISTFLFVLQVTPCYRWSRHIGVYAASVWTPICQMI